MMEDRHRYYYIGLRALLGVGTKPYRIRFSALACNSVSNEIFYRHLLCQLINEALDVIRVVTL